VTKRSRKVDRKLSYWKAVNREVYFQETPKILKVCCWVNNIFNRYLV
jgi:hypothetical protein